MSAKLWTVVRYPAGIWDTGGKPTDPAYEFCEVYRVETVSREQAKKKAQGVRSSLVRKGHPLPSQSAPYTATS